MHVAEFLLSMPIVFYHHEFCHISRAVQMTAQHLGIQMEEKVVDVFKGEQWKPEFLAINPQHTLPTIDDDGFILWESRAIMMYLVNKYAPDSPLYPKDPKARAIVDRMLSFDAGNIYNAFVEFERPQLFYGLPKDPEKEAVLKRSLAILEKILEKTPYAAGNNLTVVDYSFLSNLTLLDIVLDFDFGEFPKISAWLERMKKETPKYKELNEVPLQKYKEFWLANNKKIPVYKERP